MPAQQQQATGVPPFSSITPSSFDSLNNANLDTHFSIPAFSRPGRGMSLSYNLIYDSLVWAPRTTDGVANWTPVVNWGWRVFSQQLNGYVTYAPVPNTLCSVNSI